MHLQIRTRRIDEIPCSEVLLNGLAPSAMLPVGVREPKRSGKGAVLDVRDVGAVDAAPGVAPLSFIGPSLRLCCSGGRLAQTPQHARTVWSIGEQIVDAAIDEALGFFVGAIVGLIIVLECAVTSRFRLAVRKRPSSPLVSAPPEHVSEVSA